MPWYLAASTLARSVGINGAGTYDGLCADKARSSASTFNDYSFPGTVVIKVPCHWCATFCPGWTRFSRSDIELVLLQFILPTVIFALVLPCKWHFDLSPVNFGFGNGLLQVLAKALLSLIATGIIASCDMTPWTGVILALAGSMILGGIEEIVINIVSVRSLACSHSSLHRQLTSEERHSILVAVLCGKFEGGPQMITGLRTSLLIFAPITLNAPTLEVIKARLESVMNCQASFGSVVGIPTAFFLAGLLYNANQIADQTARSINGTPYAIWLMTMVYVVIISPAPLTGNNPSAATMLVKTNQRLQDRSWCNPVANYRDEEICPAPIYDRATTKLGWVKNSLAYRNKHWFRENVKLGGWMWVLVVLITGLTFSSRASWLIR